MKQSSILDSFFTRKRVPMVVSTTVDKTVGDEKKQVMVKISRQLSPTAIIDYYQHFLNDKEQESLYHHLLDDPTVQWQQGKYKGMVLPRMLWSMRDEPMVSSVTAIAKPKEYQQYTGTGFSIWTEPVKKIKLRIEQMFSVTLTYCQMNWYRNGKDYINWHPDRELVPGDSIYSLSLGCTRTFLVKPKEVVARSSDTKPYDDLTVTTTNVIDEKKTIRDDDKSLKILKNISATETMFRLEPGSLLVMNYEAGNKDFLHSLKKEPSISKGRINITFRVK